MELAEDPVEEVKEASAPWGRFMMRGPSGREGRPFRAKERLVRAALQKKECGSVVRGSFRRLEIAMVLKARAMWRSWERWQVVQ